MDFSDQDALDSVCATQVFLELSFSRKIDIEESGGVAAGVGAGTRSRRGSLRRLSSSSLRKTAAAALGPAAPPSAAGDQDANAAKVSDPDLTKQLFEARARLKKAEELAKQKEQEAAQKDVQLKALKSEVEVRRAGLRPRNGSRDAWPRF